MARKAGDPGFIAWTEGVDTSLAGKVDTTVASATYASANIGQHGARLAEQRRRRGGKIGTSGKSVIAFQIAHQLDAFKAVCWPEFKSRGLPVGWGCVTRAVNAPDDPYEPATATWTDVMNHFYQGAEVWSHSHTHMEPQPLGAGGTLAQEIEGSRQLIEANGLYAQGWQTAGVYPFPLTPYYTDFMGPTVEDMSGWSTEIGQRILSNYPQSSMISAGGKRFLPTDGAEGLGYWTFDASNYTAAKAQVDSVVDRPGMGLVLAMHPKNIGAAGTITLADLRLLLDYIKTLWDAGTIEVLTQSGLAFADPGSTRRADLLTDCSFDSPNIAANWNFVGGALRQTDGGRTGPNYLRLPSGTGAYCTQSPGTNLRVWGAHGQVWMFDGWARNVDAVNSSNARVQIYANTPGGNVTIRDELTALPASSGWKHIRIPFGIPKDATNVVVQLMRTGLGVVDYDDVHEYAC